MRLQKTADGVTFAEDELENAFYSLAQNSPLKNSINKAIKDLKEKHLLRRANKKRTNSKRICKEIQDKQLMVVPIIRWMEITLFNCNTK